VARVVRGALGVDGECGIDRVSWVGMGMGESTATEERASANMTALGC
jgi:hypothetical protein